MELHVTRIARLLVTPAEAPAFNMALDQVVLHEPPTVRFYGFDPPGLTLGYFQEAREIEGLLRACPNAVAVRRVTGGAAICHQDDLTFSIVAGADDPIFSGSIESSYDRIHDAVAAALSELGVASGRREAGVVTSDSRHSADPICFYKATRYDLVCNGRKLVGSAQRRTRERILHHGSIPLRPNPLAHAAADVSSLLGRIVGFDEMAEVLARAFARAFHLELSRQEMTDDERLAAERLVVSMFGADEWNRRR